MKNKVKLFGVALLCCACASQALTLGRLRGAAVLGLPLNVAIQVQTGIGADPTASCFGADVAYGDTPLAPSQINVAVEALAQPAAVTVRILAKTRVNEPLVNIDLHSTCGATTSRHYVLLADFPNALTGSRVAVAPLAGAAVPLVARASPAAAKPVSDRTTAGPAIKATAAKAAPRQRAHSKPARASTALAAPQAAAQPSAPESAPVASQARLQLDPFGVLSDHVVDIDSTIRLVSVEDPVRSLQKKELLEADLKALRATTKANEAALQSVKLRLQEARAQRSPTALVYGLLAAVLVCLGVLFYMWRRARRVPPASSNWAPSVNSEQGMSSGESRFGESRFAGDSGLGQSTVQAEPALGQSSKPSKPRKSSKSGTAGAELADDAWFSSKVNVTMVEMSDSSFDDLAAEEANGAVKTRSSRSNPPAARPAFDRSADALLDIRHQAQFLVSINKPEQAVALLKQVIHESKQPHPALCLDLLDLLHARGLKTDFQQNRSLFNHTFNGIVPQFSRFSHEGRGLEGYPKVLSRITALWRTPAAQDYIGSCLFPAEGQSASAFFELAAYRDLLLLHALAKDPGRPLRAGDERSAEGRATSSPTGSPEPSDSGAGHAPGAPEVDLDFDLSHAEWRKKRDRPAHPVDITLPIPHGAATAQAEASQDHEDLIDFDLSVKPKPVP